MPTDNLKPETTTGRTGASLAAPTGSVMPCSLPPKAKKGWDHSDLCLVYYQPNPEAQQLERWSIAYYHWQPPFKEKPQWVDFLTDRENPDFWWSLPDAPNEKAHLPLGSGGGAQKER